MSALSGCEIQLLALPEDCDEVCDAPARKVEIVDTDTASLSAAERSLAQPNLSEATRSGNEVARLRVREDALLERHQIIMGDLPRPLEARAVRTEPGGLHESPLHHAILPRSYTTSQ